MGLMTYLKPRNGNNSDFYNFVCQGADTMYCMSFVCLLSPFCFFLFIYFLVCLLNTELLGGEGKEWIRGYFQEHI